MVQGSAAGGRPAADPRPQPAAQRWRVLAAGTFATAANAAVQVGVAALAPTIGERFGLPLAALGVLLSAIWVGPLLSLLPLGLWADRLGERRVLVAGLVCAGAALLAAAFAASFLAFTVLLTVATAGGASVHAAGGRSIASWFGPHERGLALGIRQAAVPAGGAAAAFALPAVAAAGGLRTATLALAAGCLVAAALAACVVREPGVLAAPAASRPRSAVRDRAVLRMSALSGALVVSQIAVTGFVTLFLHDARGLSGGTAAAVLGAIELVAVAARVATGRVSDVVGSRIGPLRAVAGAGALSLAVATALLESPLWLLVPAFVVAGGISMAWNGLAFTATAELAGTARAGAAIGVQQTVLSAAGVAVPAAFALLVAATSWRLGYALAAIFPAAVWVLLRGRRV